MHQTDIRKNIFLRIFPCSSPWEKALIGFFGSFGCCMILLPLLIYSTIPCFLKQHYAETEIAKVIWIILYIYFQITAGTGYAAILKQRNFRYARLLAVLAAIFWPFAGVVFLPGCHRQHRRWSGGAAIASILCTCLAIFDRWSFSWALLWGCLEGFLLSVLWQQNEKRLRFRAFIPLIAMALYVVGLSVYEGCLKHNLAAERKEISAAVGRSVETEDFWKREKQGLSIQEEPLQSLIAAMPAPGSPDSQPVSDKFIEAADALTALPARPTGHLRPEAGNICAMRLPELRAFLKAAEIYAAQITACPQDRPRILAANARLENLRDRCLLTSMVLSRLTALSIEKQRLNALAAPMAAESLTNQDWETLLNPETDYEQAFRFAMGDEASSFSSIFSQAYDSYNQFLGNNLADLTFLKRLFPLEISVLSRRDYLFSLEQIQILCGMYAPSDINAEEQALTFGREILSQARKKLYIFSLVLLPALETNIPSLARNRDRLTLARTAREILNYRKQHGRLPEDLSFLPAIPISQLKGSPIQYEKVLLKNQDGQTSNRILRKNGFRLHVPEEDTLPHQTKVQYFVPVSPAP